MDDSDQAMTRSSGEDSLVPERLLAFDEFSVLDERSPGDLAAGLTSVGFLGAALRRAAPLWITLAIVGMLAGFGIFTKFPPPYQASTTVLLTTNPAEDPISAIDDDQALAQTRAVAALAVRELGLDVSPGSFMGTYTVTVVTPKVLQITVKASSSDEAVRRANVIASTFLTFRAAQVKAQNQVLAEGLHQEIVDSQAHIATLDKEISRLPSQGGTPAQQIRLSGLRSQRRQAATALIDLRQAVSQQLASTQVTTTRMLGGSKVLDSAAPVKKSRTKLQVIYIIIGLIGGLVIGMGIAMLRALTSDRLRRRDDIARVLGSPVRFSVGPVRLSRWRPGQQGLAAADTPRLRRVVEYLDGTLRSAPRRITSLAIVPVDETAVPAVCAASLAISCAKQGVRVLIADLCDGAPVAQLLGSTEPGVQRVTVEDARLRIAIPEPGDLMPVGPLGRKARRAQDSGPLAAAYESADLLITFATLDPALGSDHLAGWARSAIAFVTAGQSSVTRVHAAGEMIRLAGIQLHSAVLIGADKNDESLGEASDPAEQGDFADAGLLGLGSENGSALSTGRSGSGPGFSGSS